MPIHHVLEETGAIPELEHDHGDRCHEDDEEALVGKSILEHPRWQKYLVYAAEQLGIFTYIYVPLGLIGLLVVLVRNFP